MDEIFDLVFVKAVLGFCGVTFGGLASVGLFLVVVIEHYRNEKLIIEKADDLVESKNYKLFVDNNIFDREEKVALDAE